MVEEEVKEEEKKTDVNTKEKRYDFLSEARDLAARNEKAVEDMRELVSKNEELAAQALLGGRSEGRPQEEPKKEETPEEYAAKVMKGEFS